MWASATAKTKSALKRAWRLVLVALLVGLIVWVAVLQFRSPVSTELSTAKQTYTLSFASSASAPYTKSRMYYLNAATSGTAQELGLGGRNSMAMDRGMLFSYPFDDTRCFWMKGMRFSLDIIWTDTHKKVTHIEKNVAPETYPQQYCAVGRYIIELNAGQAEEAGITEGQTLTF